MPSGVFEIFKIGVGPSSSHTMGPMIAAARFLHEVEHGDWPRPAGTRVARIRVALLGSLAFTGHGHASDRAVMLGLLGFLPETFDAAEGEQALAALHATRTLPRPGGAAYGFDPTSDCVFDYDTPSGAHPNAMVFEAIDADERTVLRRRYYSVGGGFVREEAEMGRSVTNAAPRRDPFTSADELVALARSEGVTIAQIARRNEALPTREVNAGLDRLVAVMNECIDRGLAAEGTLPGGLNVRRRARAMHAQLLAESEGNAPSPTHANDWLTVFALAVNEENAAGGRVVTAPTNGAAGVVPATMRYLRDFVPGVGRDELRDFMLTAGAVGALIKHNASISGAEVGCQGEVGSAAAMAAAGLAAVRGGTPEQVEHAAEIALEHHLGMTCDPVGGLVQVPCIERNAFGAIKAFAAASLALRTPDHVVSLDQCVAAMRETGRDMDERYKETSRGGLAVNVAAC